MGHIDVLLPPPPIGSPELTLGGTAVLVVLDDVLLATDPNAILFEPAPIATPET